MVHGSWSREDSDYNKMRIWRRLWKDTLAKYKSGGGERGGRGGREGSDHIHAMEQV